MVYNIKKIHTHIVIYTLLQVFFSYSVFGYDYNQKSYYVMPIDVVCDYPFNDTTKWVITCRIWGLLKYYHPNVTAGKFDWDQVLIDRIVKINEAETPEQVNKELMNMIRIAGEYDISKDSILNDSLNMNVNLCWLERSFVNDTIIQSLKKLSYLTINQPNYYIRPEGIMEYPTPFEKDYDKDVIIHYEYRLLSLFRFWNVIYYFFPNKYLMDQSWDITLYEFIPKFITAIDTLSYHNAINKLSTYLNDGHGYTSVVPLYNQFAFHHIKLIDTFTIVLTPPEGSRLEKGDIILSIDGKSIHSARDSIAALIPSSNKLFTEYAVNGWIYVSVFLGCNLTVLRNGYLMSISEERKTLSFPLDTTSAYHSISKDIGYVNLDKLKESEIYRMMESFKNYKGIIFDLRNYPQNFHVCTLFQYISVVNEYCKGLATKVDFSHCGAFYITEYFENCPDELWKEQFIFNGKTVVLINASTMSKAELWAMMYKMYGATLIGTPTAGAIGRLISFPLPGRIIAGYSGIGFYYHNGSKIQRTGIIPDIEVYPTIDDVIAGRDEILESAIKFLNSIE